MIAEYEGSTVKKRYVHGPGADEPLVEYTGTGTSSKVWLISDSRGSITGHVNASGTSVATNSYDSHGKPGASNEGRFQYTGQMYIEEIDLYYYKARFYSADLKRFLQTDPIGYGDGLNMYGYVGGDAINMVDPSGLSKFERRVVNYGACRPTDTGVQCGTRSFSLTLFDGIYGTSSIRQIGPAESVSVQYADAGAGDSESGEESENSCTTISEKINEQAIRAAGILRGLGASDGNEHGFLIGVGPRGSIGLIGPYTSGLQGDILEGDIVSALGGFSGPIVGSIHNHPRSNLPGSGAMNRANLTLSLRDLNVDNVLSARGYNVQNAFTHFLVGTDNRLRLFNEGGKKIVQGSKVVRGCKVS